MARGGERDTLIRLQRNVLCLALCLTFGVVFSKSGIQLMNEVYDGVASATARNLQIVYKMTWPTISGILTEDGDEEEARTPGQVEGSGEKLKDHIVTRCPNGQFTSAGGQCVCYEKGVNFVGHSVAKADDVETYQECQKLCESQSDCHYWAHYSGLSSFNSCFLKTKLGKLERENDNTDAVNYVSGSKTCMVPVTEDVRYNPSPPKTEPVLSHSTVDGSNPGIDNTRPIDQTMYAVIAEHCLPKLVCELHAKSIEEFESFSESERTLVSLIGSSTISGSPSKYHFAAHFGQLIRGVESQGCMNFYPKCPFSGNEVRTIARKIAKVK